MTRKSAETASSERNPTAPIAEIQNTNPTSALTLAEKSSSLKRSLLSPHSLFLLSLLQFALQLSASFTKPKPSPKLHPLPRIASSLGLPWLSQITS